MSVRSCPSCSEPNPADARLCGMCRTALVADGAGDEAGDGGKLVTVVTSDLKGSTALGERLDPESLREVLNRYFAVMRVVFESHGGTIEKIIGDAIVAVFGLPVRHEDDPIRGVEAAAETQRALATLNDELDQLWGVRLVNRTGIATGIVHFGRDAEGQHVLIGDTMDESTAMEQNAPPLEALMAASTYDLVRDVVEAEDMGLKSPKGSSVGIQSFRLVSVPDRPTSEDPAPPATSPGMRACQVCGEESPERYRYCNACGASAATVTARDSRKTVTIVFANPKPHTEGGAALEPRAFTDVMTRYFEAMKVALERHGGTVEKFIGDAVMAVFGLPVRHEDDALRAVRAAADMQAALPALNDAFGREYGVRLLNHIGVNTGEVIATGDASTGQRLVTGDAVNTAARLEQAAGPAEIILGELTHRLTRAHVESEEIAPLALKGKTEPVAAFRFLRVRDRPADHGATRTQFVAREAEMARLVAALERARTARRAVFVTVVGDAGVGKSRLIREFAAAGAADSGLVRGRCLPYGDGITFWPLAEIVRDAAGITPEDDPRTAIRRIGRLLDGPAFAAERPAITDRIASMMNLSKAAFPVAELMWGMRRLLQAIAGDRPLVILIDDIHSAEQTFLEFIDYLLDTGDEASLVVLCSARLELLERHPDWAGSHAEDTITLTPLTDGEVGRLVGELLGDLDPAVRDRIATAAEGNPLYTEQIVSMLQETGAIRRDGDRWISVRASAELAIPPTVQALVAARLDALGTGERAVIEPASVIGLSFAKEALAELVDDDARGHLEMDLGSLAAKQFVRRASGDDDVYRFGHLLIKDTAYGSLLKRLRAALHERFVGWAERVNRERGRETEFEEILGYHLERAYTYRTELGVIDDDARSVGERASAKLAAVGRRAFTRGDLPAAVSLLRRASSLLPDLNVGRVGLLADLAEALISRGGFEEAFLVLDEGARAAELLGNERLGARMAVVRLLADAYSASSETSASEGIARAMPLIRTLERHEDHGGLVRAWRLVMANQFTLGDLTAAAAAAERVVEHGSLAGDTRLAALSAPAVAYVMVHGPTPVPEGIARCEELLATLHGDRINEAVVVSALAQLRAMDGDFEAARGLYRRGQEMLIELGGGIEASSTSIESSRVELLAGDPDAAERELRRDDAALAALDESYFRSTVTGLLANVLARRGALDEAMACSVTAEKLSDADDVWSQVAWRTARARVLAGRGAAEEAVSLARQAVDLAAVTEDVSLRAETFVELADVLNLTGAADESGPPIGEALKLFELKGDRTSAAALAGRMAPA